MVMWGDGGESLTCRGIDHGVHASLGVVGVDEVVDPGYHCRGGETVTGCAGGVVLDVEHTGEGDTILGPAATVGEEVVGLGGSSGGAGVGEMVASTDEAGLGSAGVLGGERGGDEGGAFGGLGGFS